MNKEAINIQNKEDIITLNQESIALALIRQYIPTPKNEEHIIDTINTIKLKLLISLFFILYHL